MSMDFIISEITKEGIDEKGRRFHVMTELEDFGKLGGVLINYLGDLSYTLDAGNTREVDGMEFKHALTQMEDELLTVEHDGNNGELEIDLRNTIQAVKDFMKDNDLEGIEDYGERYFDVYLSY